MAGDSITSANSVFTLVVAGLYPAPQQLIGYSADKAFADDAIAIAEENMGVDGRMTAGYVFSPTPMTITLQPDSPSRTIFQTIIQASKTLKDVYYLTGTITLPSTRESYTLTRGVLKTVKQIPDAAKVLQPLEYQIVWESVNRAIL
jgi:hypothetical protein